MRKNDTAGNHRKRTVLVVLAVVFVMLLLAVIYRGAIRDFIKDMFRTLPAPNFLHEGLYE